jgi:hypothetical protein
MTFDLLARDATPAKGRHTENIEELGRHAANRDALGLFF